VEFEGVGVSEVDGLRCELSGVRVAEDGRTFGWMRRSFD